MDIRQFFTTLVLVVFGIVYSGTAYAEPDFNYTLLSYRTSDVEIRDMPFVVRDVPIHSDDGYANPDNQGAIEQTKYESDGSISFSLNLWQTQMDFGTFGFNALWDIPLFVEYNISLRNYTNHVGTSIRGYGAALTYVTATRRGIIPRIDYGTDFLDFINVFTNISPEVFFETHSEHGHSSYGVSLSYYALEGENGWDRFDRFEFNEGYKLADVYTLTLYVRKDSTLYGIFFPSVNETALGLDADLRSQNGIFLSTGF